VNSPHTIIVINPGSTSTKLALAADEELVKVDTIRHPSGELGRFKSIWEQSGYRLELCRQWASAQAKQCSAVVAMGGLLRPIQGGTYLIDDAMLADARANLQGEHASNLGCALAHELAHFFNCPAYIVDAVSVDEFDALARYSGHPLIERRSLSHSLNIHAAARRAAAELSLPLQKSAFIVAHLGGGVSVAPVRHGRIVDVNDASSDGPFSPERTGGLPLQPFIRLCYSGKLAEKEMRRFVMGTGGLVAYLGTNSADEVERRMASGDTAAREVFEAMAYQIAKEIGAMATVLCGRLDAIVLTGGLANSKILIAWIKERVDHIGRVIVYPGEDEMRSLAQGALRVLRGEEQPKTYGGV